MTRFLLTIPLLALAACAGSQPVNTVRALYGEDAPLNPAIYPRYFAQDLAAAMAADAGQPGDGGTVNFDYRYDAQDMRIAGLAFQGAQTDYGNARATASFRNLGEPKQVVWNLCQAQDGAWRIADAGNSDDIPWTLRETLDLPADVSC